MRVLIAVFGVLFGLTQSSVLIVVFGLAYTLVSNVYSNALHVYLAESYPTEVRAGAAGAAFSMSKLSTGHCPSFWCRCSRPAGSGIQRRGGGPVGGVHRRDGLYADQPAVGLGPDRQGVDLVEERACRR